jgi:hypothetical protein
MALKEGEIEEVGPRVSRNNVSRGHAAGIGAEKQSPAPKKAWRPEIVRPESKPEPERKDIRK